MRYWSAAQRLGTPVEDYCWKVPRHKRYVIIHSLMLTNQFPSSLVLTYPLAQ